MHKKDIAKLIVNEVIKKFFFFIGNLLDMSPGMRSEKLNPVIYAMNAGLFYHVISGAPLDGL